MSRAKKLLLVGLVLVLGFGLAWPFRKTDSDTHQNLAVSSMGSFGPSTQVTAQSPPNQIKRQPAAMGSPQPHVVAKMASTAEPAELNGQAPEASFDLANHPAIAGHLPPRATSPVTPDVPPRDLEVAKEFRPAQVQPAQVGRDPSLPKPAYNTVHPDRLESERGGKEVRHVVQNSDTLEKLAQRYLGDASRALEIFDLNRDILDNPHLLPIEAELRIPADATKFVD